MNEQFQNAMMMAMDAYNACNEDECKSFCNQALINNPKSANAKALKGASVLISFSLGGAESDAVEALKIWQSITDDSDLTDEFKDIVINAAFDFRKRWYDAAKAHYKEFKNVKGADGDWSNVKSCYELFMNNVAKLPWLLNYKKFLELTLKLVQEQFGSLKEVTFAENVYKANKGKDGELGVLANQIEAEFGKLKKRRLIKTLVIIGLIVIVVGGLMIYGHVAS